MGINLIDDIKRDLNHMSKTEVTKVYKYVRKIIAELPVDDFISACDNCDDGINCSGCKRFSKYCKKCTNG